MNTRIGHSENDNGETQSLQDHTHNVARLTKQNAESVANHMSESVVSKSDFVRACVCASLTHDIGKADDIFDAMLKEGKKKHPNNHVDAGVAICYRHKKFTPMVLGLGHHIGNADFPRLSKVYRDTNTKLENGKTQSKHTDDEIKRYEKELTEIIKDSEWESTLDFIFSNEELTWPGSTPAIFYRFGLSTLVDADHEDTAIHFLKETHIDPIQLNPSQLYNNMIAYEELLYDKVMSKIKSKDEKTRVELRRALFNECSSAKLAIDGHRIVMLPAPVGSGKTYAAMINMLAVAKLLGLRRIFVVLPYKSIIDQNVQKYIEALVSAGVSPEQIITANHGGVEYESVEHRHLSTVWKTQIIVTTSVQFFETLSNNKSRKLHYLAGSAIFLDEFHTIPLPLWKLSWKWIKELSEHFGCYIVLGSGTFIRGWDLKEFGLDENIPSLMSPSLTKRLNKMEKNRVSYKTLGTLTLEKFITKISKNKEGCLVVCDTVLNAATVASILHAMGKDVEHLSTALCPADREKTMLRVTEKLDKKISFFLVATSCVDSGMDFSFRVSYRERCSVESLLQTGGRTSRNNEYADAVCYDFTFKKDERLTVNPTYKYDREVVKELFDSGEDITAEKMTEYKQKRFQRQIGSIIEKNEELMKWESEKWFCRVRHDYHIISNPTIPVLINKGGGKDIADRIRNGKYVSSKELEKYCVNVYEHRLKKLETETLIRYIGENKTEELYLLTGPYDEFLGYMRALV